MTNRRKHRNGERGQVLILCAVSLVVLLLFVGLAIDFGLAYVTKASLGKAVDAAALTAAKYTALGQTQSTAIANSSFAMNYGNTSRDVNPPVLNVAYSTDSLGNTLMSISATSTIKTYFIGLLPQFSTLSVSSAAQAKFARVVMTLVLDSSGSMGTNAPGTALPDAVTGFINNFDDVNDSVALVSFNTNVTANLPMQTGNFRQAIIDDAKTISQNFKSGTFSDGGLQEAIKQEGKLSLPGNVVHVVVFFTDGNANTIQNSLTCTAGGLSNGTWNFGGYDGPSNVGFFDTSSGIANCTNCCTAKFPAASQGGNQVDVNWANVSQEAVYRAIADANTMRAATPPTIVYAIGLKGPAGSANMSLLCQVANDPSSTCKPYFTYNPNTPTGEMVMAADVSQLSAAFQQIASDIHLRLLR